MALSKPGPWQCRPVIPAIPSRFPLTLTVQSLTLGETFNIEIEENESVYGLKNMIRERLLMEPSEQRLLIDGTPMSDAGYLSDYHVKKHSVICLIRRQVTFGVSVKNCDGGAGVNVFTVKYNDNVRSLKRKIFQAEGIPVQKQFLSRGGCSLDDDKLLSFYGIRESSQIDLMAAHLTSGQIFVKTPNGNNITLSVDSYSTVESIKEMVGEREGLLIDEQRLVFAGKQLEVGHTLSDYGVGPNSTIDLSLTLRGGMEITVRLHDQHLTATTHTQVRVPVLETDSVGSVKEKLIAANDQLKAVEMVDQQLFFNGKFLENNMSLESYDIQSGAVLDLKFPLEECRRVIVETSYDYMHSGDREVQ